jgi:ketosteroid isomerase-like protein
MLRAFALFAILSFAVLPAAAHPPNVVNKAGEKAIAEEVLDFRKRMADAIKRKDAAALRDMYAEHFQHIHTSAKFDQRDARVVAALAGDPVIETADTIEIDVRAHAGGWAAVVTGLSPIKAMTDGKIYAVRWTAFYVRTDTSWQLAASHATRSHEIK